MVKHGKKHVQKTNNNGNSNDNKIVISNNNGNIESFAVREKQDIDSILFCCWVEMCLSSSHRTHTIYIEMYNLYVRITKMKKNRTILSFF